MKKVSLEGVISTLRLIEMPLGKLTLNAEGDLIWPEAQETRQCNR